VKRATKIQLGIGIVAVVASCLFLTMLGDRARQKELWTDGRAVRVSTLGAPVREVLWRPAEPLPGAAGGSTDEYEPRYSADGTTLVFVRGRAGQNADLFTSRWSPTGWSEPTPIQSVNTPNDELGPELSQDGTSLYFYSDRPGGLGGYDLWVSHSSEGQWGTPTNLGPRVNSPWNEYGPALSAAGDRLYFSSNRPRAGEAATPDNSWSATVREHRTRHDYDLYIAPLGESTSANAEGVTALNTPADEGAPAVSPAGDFLYFASDREGGLGGFDLYRARIADNGDVGPPENLGVAINSPANDLDPALTSDGFRLCFSSDRQMTSGPIDITGPGSLNTSRAPHYSLWSSASREVYRTNEVFIGPSAWSLIWPWVLLLVLTVPPAPALRASAPR